MYSKNQYDELCKVIKRHNHLYFDLDQPEIDDSEYDLLVSQLKHMESVHPEWKSDISPMMSIGASVSENRKIVHKRHMLSFDKSFSLDELLDFDRRTKKVVGVDCEYCAEEKIDGCAVAISYDEGKLKLVASRGDGFNGDDITASFLSFVDVVTSIDLKDHVEIRGEVYMLLDEFEKVNKEREKKGLKLFANSRNCTSGILRRLEFDNNENIKLKFFAYEVVGKNFDNISLMRTFLIDQGFEVPSHYIAFADMNKIWEFIVDFSSKRDLVPYKTDGVVVKVHDFKSHNMLGFTGQYYKWAIAFKYDAKRCLCKIEDIVFQVGRTGAITPVAILNGAHIDGSYVKRVSLHNFSDVLAKDIRVGDFVWVEKRGDIIPQILSVDFSKRQDDSKLIEIPVHCPSCKFILNGNEDGKIVFCRNKNCRGAFERKVSHFVSKGGMNIEGLGPQIIKKLIKNGLISSLTDIYKLSYDDLVGLEGFGDQMANNLLRSISISKKIELYRFIFALGIKCVGKVTAKNLERHFINIKSLSNASVEDIEKVNGIGHANAVLIHEYFKNNEEVNELMNEGISFKSDDLNVEKSFFNGKSFCITGSFKSFSRSYIEDLILKSGGKLTSNISKNVDFLLVGENPGSKLKKANDISLKLIYEDELANLL